jgi:uncharacterized protein YjdB
VIVVAAGNDGFEVGAPGLYAIQDNDGKVVRATGSYDYPASFIGINNMIVVGSIDKNNRASYFSNWSSKFVQLLAPGNGILSTYNNGNYEPLSGTSMAAPHVTGAIALLSSHNRSLTPEQLKSHLLQTANGDVNPTTSAVTINPPTEGLPMARQVAADYKLSMYGLLDIGKAIGTNSQQPVPVTGVTLSPSGAFEMIAGQTKIFTAIVSPENATNKKVSWSSLDGAVATVVNGVVTARSAGSTIIVAITDDNAQQDSISLTVVAKTPNPIPDVKPQGSGSGSGGGCSTSAFGFSALAVVTLTIARKITHKK